MEKFIQENYDFCTLVKVNLERATIVDAEAIKTFLASIIQSGKKNLLLDLSNIRFMDSTFLGAIVVSLKRAISVGGDLCLVACECKDSVVWTMFQATRMDKVFKVFENKESALNSFR